MTTSRGWLPVATGLLTAGLALWVATVVSGPERGAATEVEPVAEAAPPPPTTQLAAPDPLVITTPPPEMDGLTESIARVLAANGFVSSLTEEDIAVQLPGSVYRTLIDQGVVLTIATEDAGR